MNTKFGIILPIIYLACCVLYAQVSISPASASAEEEITIIYDATQGASALSGESSVYMHAGVITSGFDGTGWEHVVGNWGQDDGIGKMTKVEGEANKWEIKITPRTYFNVPNETPIFRLAMVFRSADGSKEGKNSQNSDIFANLNAGFYVKFNEPSKSEVYAKVGDKIPVEAELSSTANISLFLGDELITQTVGTSFSGEVEITKTGDQTVKITADTGAETAETSFTVKIYNSPEIKELPSGTEDGITYLDDNSVRLVLYAPEKKFVYVIGDFNNWETSENYYMNQTSDGKRFWIDITNLEAKKEYIFQYFVDGEVKIGDPYSEKISDPWSDPSINFLADEKTPYEVYPNLLSYPEGKDKNDGLASVIQTAQDEYEWQIADYQRPKKENLVIYELLIRDFHERHDYKTLIDSIGYFKNLGVNAIELLPIMEFENNNSWGYNPSFHLAVDKYYGDKNDLKKFIDVCHENGIAVILDMVLNHAFGQSPLYQLYASTPEKSPYFNVNATHPYNVGFDFNHETEATQYFVDKVNKHWLENYKFDGFRFDLSKGFTQVNNPNDVGAWGNYDASRVALLKRMADKLWEVDKDAYVILEHFGGDKEEKELGDMGMMLWNNMNWAYRAAVKDASERFDNAFYESRGREIDEMVTYMESHDEERIGYEAKLHGKKTGSYDVKELKNRLRRTEASAAMFFTIPGAKMFWQFCEYGYDYDINLNGRVGRKPIRWDYLNDPDRYRLLQVFSELIKLRTENQVFTEGETEGRFSGETRRMTIKHSSMNAVVVANFGFATKTMTPSFPTTGIWYDYFSGQEFDVLNISQTIDLEAGEFHVFTDKKLEKPDFELPPLEVEEPEEPTATEARWLEAGIAVFPNPTKGKLRIQFEQLSTEKSRISMFDLTGKNVLRQVDFLIKNIELDLSNYPKGVYLLKLEQGNKLFTKKIAVQ